MSMILKYESSNGSTYDLKVKPIRTRSANFHDYSWEPQIVQQQYGERVTRFDKTSATYTAILDISGSEADRRATLNDLHAAFDADVFAMKPGRIIHGDYYVQCFITYSSTYYDNPWTQNEITIYCPYPFWVKENLFEFLPEEDTPGANNFLDYDYDFEYDYNSGLTGQALVSNPGAGAANYKAIFYGPCADPYLFLDGVMIGVNTLLLTGEYLVIDSRDHTVYKVANNGTKTNCYNDRVKTGVSIFEKIAPGDHFAVWPGTYGFDIIVFEERSEPLWS